MEVSTTTPIIKISGLSAAYERHIVLRDVDLTVYKNDFLGIIGPNGGGKTTLVKCMLGLLKPVSGKIQFYENGTEVNHIAMGYLPQYNSIDKKFPISVEEVILSGLNIKKPLFGGFSAEHREKAQEIVKRMGLDGLQKRAIGQLSGGQLQRALLGRALISDPEVIILDEPNTYIDKKFETALYQILKEINGDCSIVIVSHDIGTILQQVKSVACVNETLDYHPDKDVDTEWMEKNFNCPIGLLGHGDLPHRILGHHHHEDS
jgi:zinc transport system ATP-binding protein